MSENLESDCSLGRAVWKRSWLQSRLIWGLGGEARAKMQGRLEWRLPPLGRSLEGLSGGRGAESGL